MESVNMVIGAIIQAVTQEVLKSEPIQLLVKSQQRYAFTTVEAEENKYRGIILDLQRSLSTAHDRINQVLVQIEVMKDSCNNNAAFARSIQASIPDIVQSVFQTSVIPSPALAVEAMVAQSIVADTDDEPNVLQRALAAWLGKDDTLQDVLQRTIENTDVISDAVAEHLRDNSTIDDKVEEFLRNSTITISVG